MKPAQPPGLINGSKGSTPEGSETEEKDSSGKKTRVTALTPLEEHQLATYISLLSRSGKSISNFDIKVIAQQILQSKDKIAFNNKDNLPTGGWIQKFKHRHPELDYKPSDPSASKTPPTKEHLASWQCNVRDFLKRDWKIESETFFSSQFANRIFTCDEIVIAFTKLDKKGEKVPVKSLLKANSGEEKQLVTVIAAASAAGEYLKPHLLLPGNNTNTCNLFPTLDQSSYCFESSSSGLIDSEIFHKWVNYFDSYLTANNVTRPVILLLDDHQAHFHISIFLDCLEKQIIPLCIPPKLNKLLQPLLANFFPKLMVAYQACCKRYSQKTGNGVTHDSFPYIMMKAWTLVSKPKFITDAFSSCNLIPLAVENHDCLHEEELVKIIETSKDEKKEEIAYCASDVESLGAGNQSSFKPESDDHLAPVPDNPSKKRKLSQSSNSSSNNTERTVILGDKFVSDERKIGRQEGVDMCLALVESFVPADILPVWKKRMQSHIGHMGTSEISYCMWQALSALRAGGMEVVGSTQQQQLHFNSENRA